MPDLFQMVDFFVGEGVMMPIMSVRVCLSKIFCIQFISLQMAFELYEMLAGNVNPVTGEYIKPACGGDDEAFLQNVVTPIYNTIAKVRTYECSIIGFA